MKNIKIPAIVLITALGLSACNKPPAAPEDPPIPDGVGSLTISFDSRTDIMVATRGDEGNSKDGTESATAAENEIRMIEFFAFDAAGDPAGEGAYFRKDITSGTSLTTTILVSEGDMTFLAVVNADIFADVDDYNASTDGKTYNDIKALIAVLALSSANSQTAPAAGYYVMTDEASMTIVEGVANNLTMRLDRLLSKIMAPTLQGGGVGVADVLADADALDTLFGTDIAGGDAVANLAWVFDGYVVINGISNSYVFRYFNWTGWAAQTGWNWNKSAYDATGSALVSAYGAGTTGDLFIASNNQEPVFAYENRPSRSQEASGAATVFEQDEVTAFLIKGHFTADVTPDGGTQASQESDPRYWRVNLLRADTWDVYRNSVYRVTINNVRTIGFATPQEAEEDGPIVDPSETSVTITIVINDWDLRIEGVDL